MLNNSYTLAEFYADMLLYKYSKHEEVTETELEALERYIELEEKENN